MPLVLVPTPLGNLGDITLRSIEALKSADLIVAEDTRVARRLLNALEIGSKDVWSYREQNAASVTGGIIERAATQRVVVVTDAGMPGISDPGSDLVEAAHQASVAVEVLPGASAALGVAVLSGFPLRRFLFEGFPPRTSGDRKRAFAQSLAHGITTLWYESPQRIASSLADLAAIAPDARVFLLREYTKKFEQHLHGSPAKVAAALDSPIRGEIAFAVAPYEMKDAPSASPIDIDAVVDEQLAGGRSVAEIAKYLAERGAGERRNLYARVSERKRRRAGDER
jgi:16S rRNA (cytidine1402-2'-O)-methyltransferase